MGTLFREIDQSQVDVEDLFFMLKQQPIIKEKENAIDYNFQGGNIELRNVAFKHLLVGSDSAKKSQKIVDIASTTLFKDEYLFKDLSLKIKSGTSNAIVGHSGFGKTTMINMVVSNKIQANHVQNRIYDPAEGEVYIDGQNLKYLKFESYRKFISVIP